MVKEHEGLQEGFPAVAALEGLLCCTDPPLLLAVGAEREGLVLSVPVCLRFAVHSLVLEEA